MGWPTVAQPGVSTGYEPDMMKLLLEGFNNGQVTSGQMNDAIHHNPHLRMRLASQLGVNDDLGAVQAALLDRYSDPFTQAAESGIFGVTLFGTDSGTDQSIPSVFGPTDCSCGNSTGGVATLGNGLSSGTIPLGEAEAIRREYMNLRGDEFNRLMFTSFRLANAQPGLTQA
ncbi:MAG: hypothetical protein SFZ03_11955 [Candidatus Melainabacteria bacterium]|nr:hypothetical protein [Candidatus Melainabacteria bacterium]